jgi:hypothetical protein
VLSRIPPSRWSTKGSLCGLVYDGELGFFDHYILQLAKKLTNCQVFGVAGDESLNYAESNKREWEKKGKDLVGKYLVSYKEYVNLTTLVSSKSSKAHSA